MKHKVSLRVSLAGWTVRLLPLLLALTVPVAAPAATYWNFAYTVKSNNTIDITGYTGLEDTVNIPASIKGLPVTGIGVEAFHKCRSLVSVTIPVGVTSIGNGAFSGCASLPRIAIPTNVTSIGDGAFSGCGLTNVAIPQSVTCIGEEAFSGCTNLTSVMIPPSVTSLGKGAFSGCTSLTNATIPGAISSIGDSAFSGCTSLTTVTLPDSVTRIGDWSFASCSRLINITIPKSVASIGDRAFYKCAGLIGVYFQGNAPSVDPDAFLYSSKVTIYYLKGTKGWNLQFGGRPTAWWKPQARTNEVASAISKPAPEAHTNLVGGVSEILKPDVPAAGSIQFGVPQSKDDQLYRINVSQPDLSE